MTFIVSKDERARLAVLADYVKKVSAFCPLKEKQLFLVDADKMKVVAMGNNAAGGSVALDATFDVKSTGTSASFYLDSTAVVNALSKIRSDDVKVTVEAGKNCVVFENTTQSRNLIKLATLASPTQKDIDEQVAFIDDRLALPEFKAPIEIKTTDEAKALISTFSDNTKLLDVNDMISLSKESIKVADNICIIDAKVASGVVTDEMDVLLPRAIASIIKSVDKLKFDATRKFLFINIGNVGIRVLMQLKLPRSQYPTPAEIVSIIPTDKKFVSYKMKTEELFASLEKFQGLFSSGQWRYEQVKLSTPSDLANQNEVLLHFDDMNAEVREFVAVSDVTEKDCNDEFEFLLPCLHLNQLKSLIQKSAEVKFTYNNLEATSPNGMAALIETDDLMMVTAKLLE